MFLHYGCVARAALIMYQLCEQFWLQLIFFAAGIDTMLLGKEEDRRIGT